MSMSAEEDAMKEPHLMDAGFAEDEVVGAEE